MKPMFFHKIKLFLNENIEHLVSDNISAHFVTFFFHITLLSNYVNLLDAVDVPLNGIQTWLLAFCVESFFISVVKLIVFSC